MELYLIELDNNTLTYAIAEDEGDARDKANKWVNDRFFAGPKASIKNLKLIAEEKTTGRSQKLLL